MQTKGLAMHTPQSLVYGETLARGLCAIYPLDFSGGRQAGGLVYSFDIG
jgi:hypothetical protein